MKMNLASCAGPLCAARARVVPPPANSVRIGALLGLGRQSGCYPSSLPKRHLAVLARLASAAQNTPVEATQARRGLPDAKLRSSCDCPINSINLCCIFLIRGRPLEAGEGVKILLPSFLCRSLYLAIFLSHMAAAMYVTIKICDKNVTL